MPQISILVAVYNTAQYLPQCLDSLCGQTLRDIQIICIDDCSTDQSPQILADYAQRDARITLLRTPHNSGQAAARNLGLQIATGEFTTFVDSDDWLAPDALEQALGALAQNPANDCAVMRLINEAHFTPAERREVLQRMARVLPTFSRSLITWRIKLHPFYWPFHSFAMLRAQWWLLHKWRTWRHNK